MLASVQRERAPLSDRTQVVGLSGFTTPSAWRTKVLGALLSTGPAVATVGFLYALITDAEGPVVATLIASVLSTIGGFLLVWQRPRLSDHQICAIGCVATAAISALVVISPNALWRSSYPVIFAVLLTVVHLFLARRIAVFMHVVVIVCFVASHQFDNPSLLSLLTRDLSNASWMTAVGGIVSLVRRRLDKSTQLLFVQANQDSLTGLANRFAFSSQVNLALATVDERGRSRDPHACVFLFDLDRFKDVNDTMGHDFGDALLCQVALRIDQFRASHSEFQGGALARLGGDEFALSTLVSVSDTRRAQLESLLQACIVDKLEVDGVGVAIDVSIGSATTPIHGRTMSALLQHADSAMYRNKVSHTGVTQQVSPSAPHAARRTRLLRDLDKAIGTDELSMYYQPKLRLTDDVVHGVEALVRWKHPEFGFVPPMEFIPLAEGTGLIGPLTTQVLRMAAEQSSKWADMGLDLAVAVNVSARSLSDRQFANEIKTIFHSVGADPRNLILEVTETAMMTDIRLAGSILEEIRALGIRLSIDDFGTGYCSLAYLRDLAVDELKIDRSFVFGIDNEANAVIVRAAVQLAHNLGLTVVAEGVENEAALVELRSMGCDVAQGYHLSMPLPADCATQWILAHRSTRVEATALV
jgi:diguanylate cyclase (GGDEF)-like protein